MIRKPKIFISYSSEQFEVARYFDYELTNNGYEVFYAKESIHVGDSFPHEIEQFLKKCDGVIILISNASVKSEWCKYEFYYSFFSNKILIPIITEPLQSGVRNPLDYFQKDINYVTLEKNSESGLKAIYNKIGGKLRSVRKASLKKLFRFAGVLALLSIAGVFFFEMVVNKINSYTYARDKRDLIEKIEKSGSTYTVDELKDIARKYSNDEDVAGKLYVIAADEKQSDYARLNSEILIGRLMTTFNLSKLHQINKLSWENSTATNVNFSAKAFYKCKMNNVKFDNVALPDLNFSESKMLNLFFTRCRFSGTYFNPAEATSVNVNGCKFYGCSIELDHFLNVSFSSKLSGDPNVVDASMSTFFDNCIFYSNFKEDPKNSYNFERIDAVKFSDVNFSNCNFRGYFDPDWFADCGFYDCIFSDATTYGLLKGRGFIKQE